MAGLPTKASSEAMLTMAPPPERAMAGIAALQQRKVPLRLTPMIQSQSSRVASVTRPRLSTPAPFTSTSRRPYDLSARATSAAVSASLETSALSMAEQKGTTSAV